MAQLPDTPSTSPTEKIRRLNQQAQNNAMEQLEIDRQIQAATAAAERYARQQALIANYNWYDDPDRMNFTDPNVSPEIKRLRYQNWQGSLGIGVDSSLHPPHTRLQSSINQQFNIDHSTQQQQYMSASFQSHISQQPIQEQQQFPSPLNDTTTTDQKLNEQILATQQRQAQLQQQALNFNTAAIVQENQRVISSNLDRNGGGSPVRPINLRTQFENMDNTQPNYFDDANDEVVEDFEALWARTHPEEKLDDLLAQGQDADFPESQLDARDDEEKQSQLQGSIADQYNMQQIPNLEDQTQLLQQPPPLGTQPTGNVLEHPQGQDAIQARPVVQDLHPQPPDGLNELEIMKWHENQQQLDNAVKTDTSSFQTAQQMSDNKKLQIQNLQQMPDPQQVVSKEDKPIKTEIKDEDNRGIRVGAHGSFHDSFSHISHVTPIDTSESLESQGQNAGLPRKLAEKLNKIDQDKPFIHDIPDELDDVPNLPDSMPDELQEPLREPIDNDYYENQQQLYNRMIQQAEEKRQLEQLQQQKEDEQDYEDHQQQMQQQQGQEFKAQPHVSDEKKGEDGKEVKRPEDADFPEDPLAHDGHPYPPPPQDMVNLPRSSKPVYLSSLVARLNMPPDLYMPVDAFNPEAQTISAQEEKDFYDAMNAYNNDDEKRPWNFLMTRLGVGGPPNVPFPLSGIQLDRVRTLAESIPKSAIYDYTIGRDTYVRVLENITALMENDPAFRNSIMTYNVDPTTGAPRPLDQQLQIRPLQNPQDRLFQLASLFEFLAKNGRENIIPALFRNDEETNLQLYRSAIVQGGMHNTSPANFISMVLDPRSSFHRRFQLPENPIYRKELERIRQEYNEMRMALENGQYPMAAFVQNVQNQWEEIVRIMRNYKVGEVQQASRELKNHLSDQQNLDAVGDFLKESMELQNRKDVGFLTEKIRQLKQIIATRPGSRLEYALTRLIQDTLDQYTSGRFTINQALASLNVNPRVMNALQYSNYEPELDLAEGTFLKHPVHDELMQGEELAQTDGYDPTEVYHNLGLFSAKNLLLIPENAPNGSVVAVDRRSYMIRSEAIKSLRKFVTTIRNAFNHEVGGDGNGAGGLNLDNLDKTQKRNLTKVIVGELNKRPWMKMARIPLGTKAKTLDRDTLKNVVSTVNDITAALNSIRNLSKAGKYHRGPITKETVKAMKQKIPTTKFAVSPVRIITGLRATPTTRPLPEYDPDAALRERQATQHRYSYENLMLARKYKKEEPEIGRTEYPNGAIEFTIKTDDDLKRMKTEIYKKKGELFTIDLYSGKLYPIDPFKTVPGMTYIFIPYEASQVKKLGKGTTNIYHAKGGSVAFYPALHSILRDEEELLPQAFMRDGNDKAFNRVHQLARRPKPHPNDYRDQIRQMHGASLWGAVKKGLKDVVAWNNKKIFPATKTFVENTKKEVGNFVKQEKANINKIYASNRDFYQRPSWAGFGHAVGQTISGGVGAVAQPAISAAREFSNINGFLDSVPMFQGAKMGLEYMIPPLALADGLTDVVKNLGVGSDDKARYLDALIGAGDALLGSGQLSGDLLTGARMLDAGLIGADKFKLHNQGQ